MIKNKRYVCIEEFEVPILDEEGTVLNEDGNYYGAIPIKKGSQWSLDGTDTLCGADLKLTNETNFIEISNERLEKYFVEMRENKIMEEARKCVGGKLMTIEHELKFEDSVILEIDGQKYQLTNSKGKLKVTTLELRNELVLIPDCSNSVKISQQKW